MSNSSCSNNNTYTVATTTTTTTGHPNDALKKRIMWMEWQANGRWTVEKGRNVCNLFNGFGYNGQMGHIIYTVRPICVNSCIVCACVCMYSGECVIKYDDQLKWFDWFLCAAYEYVVHPTTGQPKIHSRKFDIELDERKNALFTSLFDCSITINTEHKFSQKWIKTV